LAATAYVVIGNVALVWPAATVTVVPTVAADVLLLVSATVNPPVGAAELIVTVPVEPAAPSTLVGDRVTLVNAAGVTVSVAVWLAPLSVPVIVADWLVATAYVVIGNVAVIWPAATVTLVPTVAADVLLLVSAMLSPPVGAAELIVTVPVEPAAPSTLVGDTVMPTRLGV
jgi:hypothetical protein